MRIIFKMSFCCSSVMSASRKFILSIFVLIGLCAVTGESKSTSSHRVIPSAAAILPKVSIIGFLALTENLRTNHRKTTKKPISYKLLLIYLQNGNNLLKYDYKYYAKIQ